MKNKSILVIGNTTHSRATCVSWTWDFPNIEEFECVIVDMPSLYQSIFDDLVSKESNKFRELREGIQTLFTTAREAYCIFVDPLEPSNWLHGRSTMPNSYVWSFETPSITKVKTGQSLILKKREFKKYFDYLNEWQYEIQLQSTTHYKAIPLAVNRSGKMIAAGIVGTGKRPGAVYFLPELKNAQEEAIEIIIDLILGKKGGAEYPWREKIEIPGLSDIQREIQGYEDEMKKRISEAQQRYRDKDSYRDLFSVDDQRQVKAVKRIFSDIGIESNLTKPGFVVDLVGKEVAVEVTSVKGMIPRKHDSVTQVLAFIQKWGQREKVVLVANTYKRLPIEQRMGKEDFSREALDLLVPFGICCISAHSLYLLWKKAQEKRILPTLKELILNTVGKITQDAI
ncbi:telomere resolvase [Candidatus Bathyarchaeota archaeon]|nr:telomere resolvase [Candidatus Bathyarchaeota archaeon]